VPWIARACPVRAGCGPVFRRIAASRLFLRLARNRSFVIGAARMLFLLGIACFVGRLASYDPLRSNFRLRLAPPNAVHWFGTDHFGLDLLSRVMYANRVIYRNEIGFLVVLACGVPCGAASMLDRPRC
jgi:peptide/nickel transport system permease protein